MVPDSVVGTNDYPEIECLPSDRASLRIARNLPNVPQCGINPVLYVLDTRRW
jgi:hypothetical protein